ncbi:Gfo/Idh/MocA family protein [Pseudonocardia kunmingensis]|uniref:Putative dehydrogenase n=1 Tax=Pseudonocardia kunmingensis TaxID=630975 RepID=A0A543DQR4_9PSEU|nr:Gfo/Idh/MocA family oxidoreductase [Pseudonocardia kunmingensis]TQM11663.1 putative dehydrogenase [Pseudonocardia kunmingensis]
MEPVRIGILGCGKVSHQYLPNLIRSPVTDVVAVADIDSDAAAHVADRYRIPHAVTPDELVADRSIALVLNLTPIAAHVGVTRAALAAGKHVYSEKPLATSAAEAQELVAEAARRGLSLACAPDTLLGSGFQAGWAALAAGRIGRPLSATAVMLRSSLTVPSAYSEGRTPFLDMAPYYLSALVNLFGPAVRVSGAARTSTAGKTAEQRPMGAAISVSGVVEFASGAVANVSLVWGIAHRSEIPAVHVYGTDGAITLPNPNNFADPAYIRRYGERDWNELPGSGPTNGGPHNQRGLGVAEMVVAIQEGRIPRASAELACHVVDLVGALVRSGERGERVELTTTCTPPSPIPADARERLLV